ncbi:uncharacterized protein RSE6_11028 [Rhynchosporium secalis]|uniref:Uncharacterized protein n=1 Tax=Rhynchosporium secalis TaxID=38038 RepID=A0A1E1MLY7_RHYSE|nr:uncharacterized protein RSE6_11028 [Rhynchosporium secalis]
MFLVAVAVIHGAKILLGRGVLPSEYTGSDQALDIALAWITECTSKHEFCSDGSSKVLPSCVLDLGDNDLCFKAKTTIGDGRSFRYAAFNHCWGLCGNDHVFTRATNNSWLQPFLVTDLPQTYQDVIVVAK